MKINKISRCRICGNSELSTVADFGVQYLTGVFPRANVAETLTKGPLRLVKCHEAEETCGLLQLEHSYDLSELYGENYGYRSGLNASMVRHLNDKVARILDRVALNQYDLVIDIGSNDGTTLAAYPNHLQLVGIDPTGEKFRKHNENHIQLIPKFFSSDVIDSEFPGKKAKVITSFSMFYDLEDPVDFARQVSRVLEPKEGIWVLEQSYMPFMLERTAYDTVCHEHLEYYGLKQIAWIVNKVGLEIIDVEFNDVNGGSFSVVVAHSGAKYLDVRENAKIAQVLEYETSAGLSNLKPYHAFYRRSMENRRSLQDFVNQVNSDGKRIFGIGASTKGNVILQFCGFNARKIPVIGDVNADKYGALTPGTWIPIEEEKKVISSNPDYMLVLPWHFKDFFVKIPIFRERNLVFPLPSLEIITP